MNNTQNLKFSEFATSEIAKFKFKENFLPVPVGYLVKYSRYKE